jgi:hypothetical protein
MSVPGKRVGSILCLIRILKNRVEGRDPGLCGFGQCSPIAESAARSQTPLALVDGRMPVS